MTAEVVIRIIVGAVYAIVGLVAYRCLIARLTLSARLLASLMLAAQVVAIGAALLIQPVSSEQARLWHLDREWNIPSTLASTQLALAGGVALTTAWLAKTQPIWKRLYLLGIGLVFLYLAQDEYFEAHEFTQGVGGEFHHTRRHCCCGDSFRGAAVAAAQLVIWHACFLAGLALSAGGGLLIETQCGHELFTPIGQCAHHFMLEEPLEFLGSWLSLAALLGHFFVSLAGATHRALALRYAGALAAAAEPARSATLTSNATPRAQSQPRSSLNRACVCAAISWKAGKGLHLFLSPGRLDFPSLGFAEPGLFDSSDRPGQRRVGA